jgi:hypothetical protein
MTSVRFKFICARCKEPVYQGQSEASSALCMSDHDLCESCFFEEDGEIEEAGTNIRPDTLKFYGESNRGHRRG